MYSPAGRRGSFLLVAILLLISIGLEQCCIVRLVPWLSDLGGVQPMFVFLDIPVRAPVPIDWIPVGLIFIFFYSIVYLPRRTHRDAAMKREMQKKLWGLLGRWLFLLGCMLAAGGLFYELSDYLPKQVRNGIDSFGIRADLILPYPSDERVHLQGSMIMLVFCIIGWRLLVKKAEMPASAAMAPQGTPHQAPQQILQQIPRPIPHQVSHPAPHHIPHPAPQEMPQRISVIFPHDDPGRFGQSRLTMQIPDPVEVKERAPKTPPRRPCMSVAMPETI
jgi:hypothetical protein